MVVNERTNANCANGDKKKNSVNDYVIKRSLMMVVMMIIAKY